MRKTQGAWFDHWDKLVNFAIKRAGTPKIALQPGEIAMDSHMHSMFSYCSISQPEDIILWAVQIGLGAIAVTDHNNIEGALDAMRCADDLKARELIPEDFIVIPGIEINTSQGHIQALFFEGKIQIDMDPSDTVKAIHDAGGLAVAVHPYNSKGIRDAIFDSEFDAIEVECGSVFGRDLVEKNRSLINDARFAGVAKLGSSDGHYIRAIGSCYSVLKPEQITLEGIRKAIISGNTTPRSTPPCEKLRKLLGKIGKLK